MQRGIITLKKEELKAILGVFDMQRHIDTPMYNKFIAALESNLEVATIETSEDEIEIILDEIGMPSDSSSEDLKSALRVLREKMIEFRG